MKQTAAGNFEPLGRAFFCRAGRELALGSGFCRMSGRWRFTPVAKGMSSRSWRSGEGGSSQKTPSSSASLWHLHPTNHQETEACTAFCTVHENKPQCGLHTDSTFWLRTCDTRYKLMNHWDAQGRFRASRVNHHGGVWCRTVVCIWRRTFSFSPPASFFGGHLHIYLEKSRNGATFYEDFNQIFMRNPWRWSQIFSFTLLISDISLGVLVPGGGVRGLPHPGQVWWGLVGGDQRG